MYGRNVELDLGNNMNMEGVGIFYYLGDMLKREGGLDKVEVDRVRCKFKMVQELMRKRMLLKLNIKV